MKTSLANGMTSAYFAFDFSWGFYYAGFFGYAKLHHTAGDILHADQRRRA